MADFARHQEKRNIQLQAHEAEHQKYASGVHHLQNVGWEPTEQLHRELCSSNPEGTRYQTLYEPSRAPTSHSSSEVETVRRERFSLQEKFKIWNKPNVVNNVLLHKAGPTKRSKAYRLLNMKRRLIV